MALMSEETEYKRSLITIIESNIIFSCFKKRASCGLCYLDKIDRDKYSSFALELGKSLSVFLMAVEWIEKIILTPYTLWITMNKNTPDNEKEKIKEQIEKIIERYKDGSFMSI